MFLPLSVQCVEFFHTGTPPGLGSLCGNLIKHIHLEICNMSAEVVMVLFSVCRVENPLNARYVDVDKPHFKTGPQDLR